MRSITNNTTCSWEPSVDKKYSIGYITICRQDIESQTLGFSLHGHKATQEGHFGAIVTNVVHGSIMDVVCKLKKGDEIVEFNGFDLRNKSNEEVLQIIETSRNANPIRIVAVRQVCSQMDLSSSSNL